MSTRNQPATGSLTELIEARAIKRKYLRFRTKQNSGVNSIFSQKRVVISGSFTLYDRRSMIEQIHHSGAIIDKDISEKTDFLIVGNESNEQKISKALISTGVKILFEKDLMTFYPLDETTRTAYQELVEQNSKKASQQVNQILNSVHH